MPSWAKSPESSQMQITARVIPCPSQRTRLMGRPTQLVIAQIQKIQEPVTFVKALSINLFRGSYSAWGMDASLSFVSCGRSLPGRSPGKGDAAGFSRPPGLQPQPRAGCEGISAPYQPARGRPVRRPVESGRVFAPSHCRPDLDLGPGQFHLSGATSRFTLTIRGN